MCLQIGTKTSRPVNDALPVLFSRNCSSEGSELYLETESIWAIGVAIYTILPGYFDDDQTARDQLGSFWRSHIPNFIKVLGCFILCSIVKGIHNNYLIGILAVRNTYKAGADL